MSLQLTVRGRGGSDRKDQSPPIVWRLLMAFTFFFRDQHVLELVISHLLPRIEGYRRVRIWDAGCAMGPEPYTLAILLAERMGRFAFRNLTIEATDSDENSGFAETIETGIYPHGQVDRIPPDLLARYFLPLPDPGLVQVHPDLRSRVHFSHHDLLRGVPIGDGFHLIVCKNVLLHFSETQRSAVIRMFHDALIPDGLFCTEHTQKLPHDVMSLFERVTDEAEIYRRIG